MKHLFLINPAAGKRGSTDALCRQITETFTGLGLEHELFLAAAPGDCEVRARAAAASGEPVRLYACGGDGTLNEVVNAAAGYDNAAVTNVPKGTGNDFLKLFGPTYRSAFSDLAALAAGPQAAFDLMDCNGRLGIDVCCAGVDARIAADVHKYKAIPFLGGMAAYSASLVVDLMDCNGRLGIDVCCAGVDARIAADVHKYKAIPFLGGMAAYSASLVVNVLFKELSRPTVVRAGDTVLEGESTIICICNGRHYGGGFMPVGDAQPDDGVLDMVVVPKVSRFTFFRLVGAYARGRYREHPEVLSHFHGTSFSFSSPEALTAVVDGEILRARDFTVSLSPKKVWFFYPAGLDYRTPGG